MHNAHLLMQNPRDWTDNRRLASQLEFLCTLNQLKSVQRATRIATDGRCENSAEHSWHVMFFADVLAEYANEPVDSTRVMRMMLLHDVVEIDVGDMPIHGVVDDDKHEKEVAAAERLFGLLPEDQAAACITLWHEFESGDSADAKFARALDRLQPILLNMQTQGGTWIDYQVSLDQLVCRTEHMQDGTEPLWTMTRALFDIAVQQGWLLADTA